MPTTESVYRVLTIADVEGAHLNCLLLKRVQAHFITLYRGHRGPPRSFPILWSPLIQRTASITSVLWAEVHQGFFFMFTVGLGFRPKLNSKTGCSPEKKIHYSFHKCELCLSDEHMLNYLEKAVAFCLAL